LKGSPAVYNNGVFAVSGDGTFFGVNGWTGDPLPGWPVAIKNDSFNRATPVIGGGNVFVASSTKNMLYGFDVATGSMLPHFPIQLSSYNFGSLTFFNGNLFAGTFDGRLAAFHVSTGASLPGYPRNLNGSLYGAPTIHKGHLYVGTAGGTFYKLNLKTGKAEWKFHDGTVITSTAAIGPDGTVAFGDDKGLLHLLDIVTGKERANFPRNLGGPIGASPAVGDGQLNIGSFERQWEQYRLIKKIRRLWRKSAHDRVWASSAMTHDLVVTKDLAHLDVRDRLTGDPLWGIGIPSSQSASPVLVNGIVYQIAIDGLHAFSLNGLPPPPSPPGPGPH
jgi:outer membrane protein assembly factor BamB